MSFDTSLGILTDYEFGESSPYGMSSPDGIQLHNSKYLIVGGGIYQNAVEATGPRGSILVFDKDDFDSGPVSSVKLNWSLGVVA